jgi:hypothetical protein
MRSSGDLDGIHRNPDTALRGGARPYRCHVKERHIMSITTDTVSMSTRIKWAKAAEQTVKHGSRSRYPRYARPLTRHEVIESASPALMTIASALRDERQIVSPSALDALKTFLTMGAVSPLYGNDALAARREAERIRASILGQPARAAVAEPVAA